MTAARPLEIEWPTWVMLLLCYGLWAGSTFYGGWIGGAILAVTLALHSSLQHEALHGHPTRNAKLNEALVYPALGLLVPYRRFKDTHLAHHRDERLTDPYEDPESNYLDPEVWQSLSKPHRWLRRLNNTLLGRIVLGPAIGMIDFYKNDWQAVRRGDVRIGLGYIHHLAGLLPVGLWLVLVAEMSFVAYLLAAYAALSILRIRTFLEHRAHAQSVKRTVIIEDRGPLAWLFLNNNLHAVHHKHPRIAWYELPKLYFDRSEHFLALNGGYRYRSYACVFARYLWTPKDPVPHPSFPMQPETSQPERNR